MPKRSFFCLEYQEGLFVKETSLVIYCFYCKGQVVWARVWASTARGKGSISGWGTKILHPEYLMSHGLVKKKKRFVKETDQKDQSQAPLPTLLLSGSVTMNLFNLSGLKNSTHCLW